MTFVVQGKTKDLETYAKGIGSSCSFQQTAICAIAFSTGIEFFVGKASGIPKEQAPVLSTA